MAKTRKQREVLDPWMSLGAAARTLGETRLATLTRIVKGELAGENRAGLTFVRRDTVDRLLAARESVGPAA